MSHCTTFAFGYLGLWVRVRLKLGLKENQETRQNAAGNGTTKMKCRMYCNFCNALFVWRPCPMLNLSLGSRFILRMRLGVGLGIYLTERLSQRRCT